MMEIDPESHDSELQAARLYAVASVAAGVLSLCAAIVPLCGGVLSILGVVFGLVSMRTEKGTSATVGIAISILGFLITVVYFIFLSFFQN